MAWSNREVRLAVNAFGLLTIAEWALGTSVAIEAYAAGGALAVGVVGFRFVPAAIGALVTAELSERYRRDLLPGDTFGEIAVLHRVPPTASVTAAEPTTVLVLQGEALRARSRRGAGGSGRL
jgi:hypothetical protein